MIWSFIGDLFKIVAGAAAGYFLGRRKTQEESKLNFLNRRVEEFYSPMVACLEEIRVKSTLRLKLSEASAASWRHLAETNPELAQAAETFDPYRATIDYNNRQLKEELLPLYRKMLAIFQEKRFLADPETIKYLSVSLWIFGIGR